ncbi:MAG: hypothetical protein ABR556_11230 [Pyrinomonadaceae bacterium]
MKDHHTAGRTAALMLGAVCLATASADSMSAQGGGRSTPVERRIERANRDSEQYERESQ